MKFLNSKDYNKPSIVHHHHGNHRRGMYQQGSASGQPFSAGGDGNSFAQVIVPQQAAGSAPSGHSMRYMDSQTGLLQPGMDYGNSNITAHPPARKLNAVNLSGRTVPLPHTKEQSAPLTNKEDTTTPSTVSSASDSGKTDFPQSGSINNDTGDAKELEEEHAVEGTQRDQHVEQYVPVNAYPHQTIHYMNDNPYLTQYQNELQNRSVHHPRNQNMGYSNASQQQYINQHQLGMYGQGPNLVAPGSIYNPSDNALISIANNNLSGNGSNGNLSNLNNMSNMVSSVSSLNASVLATRGRVTVYCTAGGFNKIALREYLETIKRGPQVLYYQDALYCMYSDVYNGADNPNIIFPEVFFFDYGVLVMWSMEPYQEQDIVRQMKAFELDKLDAMDVDVDEFDYVCGSGTVQRIVDDCIYISSAHDHKARMAISYALSQSVKLSVFEESIERTIDAYKSVPKTLGKTGTISMSRKKLAKAIGHIFMQTSAVNLVSNVLDTPDFFWENPDYLEKLYSGMRVYLEITKRTEVLNKRIRAVTDMMSILKDEQHQIHSEKLEWIVIWLIVAELVVGVLGILITLVLHFY